jgi:hypothetical protein
MLHRVARLEERRVRREVRRRARERLDVGVRDAEQLARPPCGQFLDGVDDAVALVVAPGRVPLRVLVGEHRAARREHGGRHVVLGRDQAQRVVLALRLGRDQCGDARIGGFENGGHEKPPRGSAQCPGARRSVARRSPVVAST